MIKIDEETKDTFRFAVLTLELIGLCVIIDEFLFRPHSIFLSPQVLIGVVLWHKWWFFSLLAFIYFFLWYLTQSRVVVLSNNIYYFLPITLALVPLILSPDPSRYFYLLEPAGVYLIAYLGNQWGGKVKLVPLPTLILFSFVLWGMKFERVFLFNADKTITSDLNRLNIQYDGFAVDLAGLHPAVVGNDVEMRIPYERTSDEPLDFHIHFVYTLVYKGSVIELLLEEEGANHNRLLFRASHSANRHISIMVPEAKSKRFAVVIRMATKAGEAATPWDARITWMEFFTSSSVKMTEVREFAYGDGFGDWINTGTRVNGWNRLDEEINRYEIETASTGMWRRNDTRLGVFSREPQSLIYKFQSDRPMTRGCYPCLVSEGP